MEEDWAGKELERQIQDQPLGELVDAESDLFHATKALGAIEATGALLPFAEARRRNIAAESGFGQAGVVIADEHVSLTTSKARGDAYFDVLVAIAAIAESRATVEQWLGWYLARWGDPGAMLEAAATDHESEPASALASSLDALGVTTAWRSSKDILVAAVSALTGQSVVERLTWLFELDRSLMQVGEPDQGLGVVRANAEAWSKVQLSDVALLKVRLPDNAVGYLHEDEEEVRVRGILGKFEVATRGRERLATWVW